MGRSIAIEPERGPLLAGGAVLLATAVGMINTRLEHSWAHGVQFLLAGAAFALVYWIALQSPMGERPLAYQSALVLSALALLAVALLRLAQVLGADHPFNSGTLLWTSAIFAAVALSSAVRFQSISCVLLGGLAIATFVLSFIDKVFNPSTITTFRWFLLLLAIGFAVAAALLRAGPREGWSVQSVNLAGLMLIGLSATFFVAAISGAIAAFGGAPGPVNAGFGWRIVLVVGSLAVIGYAAVTRERGPGYIGFVSILFAIVIIALRTGGETIMGWPIVLLLAAAATLALGLMPRPPGTTSRAGRPPRSRPPRTPPA
jgi:hypothetical protein